MPPIALAGCVMLALLFAACAHSPATRDAGELPAYAEDKEYFVSTIQGRVSRAEAASRGVTHYFQTARSRSCYSFRVPGTWEHGREQAMLRRLDGGGLVGVQLIGLRELGAGSVEEAIRTAADRSGKIYAADFGAIPWTLAPYPRIPGAWQWTVPRQMADGNRQIQIMPRWYLAVGNEWIAQFAIGAPRDVDRDAFVDGVINSLTISREPRCYERELRELGGIRAR